MTFHKLNTIYTWKKKNFPSTKELEIKGHLDLDSSFLSSGSHTAESTSMSPIVNIYM